MKRTAAILVLAFAVRAVLLLQWRGTPYYLFPQLDDQVHLLWAREILAGHWLRERAFYQSPFYPYFMALVFRVFGDAPALMLWLQAGAGAAAAALIARLTERAHGPRAGLIAGVLAALYRPFLFQGVFLLKETWLILFLAWFAFEASRAEEPRGGFKAGVALGLAALCRGSVLALALPALWRLRGRRRAAAALALGAVLPVLPATLHNLAVSRDLTPICYTSGFAVFVGNNPEANGTMKYPLGLASSPLEDERQTTAYAERAEGRALKPSEVSRFYARKALAFALGSPVRWLKLTAFKAGLFLNGYELPDNYDPFFVAARTRTALSWPLANFRLLIALALLGAFLLGPGPTGAFAALYALGVVLTIVTERYRAPAAVFLIPLAAAFLSALADRAARARVFASWKPWAAAAPVLLLCQWPLVTRAPEDDAQGWVNLAQVHYERGEHEAALRDFFEAAAASPAGLRAGAFLFGGAAAEKLGDAERARLIYRAGLEQHPDAAFLRERLDALPRPPRRR